MMPPNKSSTQNPWLHRFAMLTALATLALIGIGGLVTSHEAGMSVPDWPSSYGYNMFLFPFAQWWRVGNVFYEHSHRLFASGVGLLTTILMVWLWLRESRAWLRWLGVVAFFAVALQGVLGGLRVVLFKDQIGIFHATLAQLFFVLTCAIALSTSRWWSGKTESRKQKAESRKLGRLFLFTTILIFLQLLLGATMRHQHAGLAISDFPLAHGKLWPDTSADAVARYNQQRMEISGINPITAFQIQLQMAHRLMAVLILFAVAACAWKAQRWSSRFSVSGAADNLKVELQPRVIVHLSLVWLGLIFLQASLGAVTLLWNKPADIATAHVLVGALSLATGAMLCMISARTLEQSGGETRISPAGQKFSRDEISFAARTSAP